MRNVAAAFLLFLVSSAAFASSGAAEKHWRLAKEYLDKGWSRHAVEEAKVTLSLDPRHEGARKLVESGGKAPVSAQASERRIVYDSADLFSQARLAYRESRLVDARKLALQVLAGDPLHEGALKIVDRLDSEVFRPSALGANDVLKEIFEEGLSLLRREEWEAAAEVLERALIAEPSHEQVRDFYVQAKGRAEDIRVERGLARAQAALAQGREAEAREELVGVLALRPNSDRAKSLLESLGGAGPDPGRKEKVKEHFNRGIEAYERGMWADAAREWDMVVTLDPGDKEAKRLLRKARGKMSRAAKENEKRAESLRKEALKCYQQGKMEESAQAYRQILEINPNDENARRNLDLIEGKAAQ